MVDQAVMTPFGSALFYTAAKLMDLQPQAIAPTLRVIILSMPNAVDPLDPYCKEGCELQMLALARTETRSSGTDNIVCLILDRFSLQDGFF